MELELGLKITHARDDVTSFADLQIAKDHTGPVFLTRETGTMFILIAYLKGFRKENVEIWINEDGNRITICGKKPVQEMVLMGWIMHKKEVELREFRKVFRIPDGVILDRIKAKFNDQEMTLTITMPKLVKGISGVGVEEVQEEEVDKGQRPEATETFADEAPETGFRKPMKNVEEIDQAALNEIDRREAVAYDALRKETDDEALQEEGTQTKITTTEETAQFEKQIVDQGQLKATEEAAGMLRAKDVNKGVLQDKPEEPKIESQEETKKVVEDMAEVGEVVPETVLDTTLRKKPGSEDQKKFEAAAIPQKAEAPGTATGATYGEMEIKEPMQVKPEKETEQPETKEHTPADEAKSEELPDLKEQEKKQETTDAKSVHEVTLEEHPHGPESNELTDAVIDQKTKHAEVPNQPSSQAERDHMEENHLVRSQTSHESEMMETETNVPETTKPASDQEEKITETPHPADKSVHEIKKEGHGQEASHGIGNEIKEAATDEDVVEHELQEKEKQTQLGEGTIDRRSPVSRRSRLCPPLVVAGSAILVSIIVLVISWIRAKKR